MSRNDESLYSTSILSDDPAASGQPEGPSSGGGSSFQFSSWNGSDNSRKPSWSTQTAFAFESANQNQNSSMNQGGQNQNSPYGNSRPQQPQNSGFSFGPSVQERQSASAHHTPQPDPANEPSPYTSNEARRPSFSSSILDAYARSEDGSYRAHASLDTYTTTFKSPEPEYQNPNALFGSPFPQNNAGFNAGYQAPIQDDDDLDSEMPTSLLNGQPDFSRSHLAADESDDSDLPTSLLNRPAGNSQNSNASSGSSFSQNNAGFNAGYQAPAEEDDDLDSEMPTSLLSSRPSFSGADSAMDDDDDSDLPTSLLGSKPDFSSAHFAANEPDDSDLPTSLLNSNPSFSSSDFAANEPDDSDLPTSLLNGKPSFSSSDFAANEPDDSDIPTSLLNGKPSFSSSDFAANEPDDSDLPTSLLNGKPSFSSSDFAANEPDDSGLPTSLLNGKPTFTSTVFGSSEPDDSDLPTSLLNGKPTFTSTVFNQNEPDDSDLPTSLLNGSHGFSSSGFTPNEPVDSVQPTSLAGGRPDFSGLNPGNTVPYDSPQNFSAGYSMNNSYMDIEPDPVLSADHPAFQSANSFGGFSSADMNESEPPTSLNIEPDPAYMNLDADQTMPYEQRMNPGYQNQGNPSASSFQSSSYFSSASETGNPFYSNPQNAGRSSGSFIMDDEPETSVNEFPELEEMDSNPIPGADEPGYFQSSFSGSSWNSQEVDDSLTWSADQGKRNQGWNDSYHDMGDPNQTQVMEDRRRQASRSQPSAAQSVHFSAADADWNRKQDQYYDDLDEDDIETNIYADDPVQDPDATNVVYKNMPGNWSDVLGDQSDEASRLPARGQTIWIRKGEGKSVPSALYLQSINYGYTAALSQEAVLLGRGEICDWVIGKCRNSHSISRQHAWITWEPSHRAWAIQDISKAGTTLNNRPVSQDHFVLLKEGDIVQFGSSDAFRIHIG